MNNDLWVKSAATHWRALRAMQNRMEHDLVREESLKPVHQVREPVMDRLSDSWTRTIAIHPTTYLSSAPHLEVSGVGYRFLKMVGSSVSVSVDTAPNRVLWQVLGEVPRQASRRARAASGEEKEALLRVRDRWLSLRGDLFEEEAPGKMRAADLFHRNLRGTRYRPVWLAWRWLREER